MNVLPQTTTLEKEVVVIIDDDIIDDDNEVQFMYTAKRIEDVYKDVEIISHKRAGDRIALSAITTNPTAATSEEVQCVGAKIVINSKSFFSHFYFNCKSAFPCPKCFCFVCDMPTAECTNWPLHHKAVDSLNWRSQREEQRRKSKAPKLQSNQCNRAN